MQARVAETCKHVQTYAVTVLWKKESKHSRLSRATAGGSGLQQGQCCLYFSPGRATCTLKKRERNRIAKFTRSGTFQFWRCGTIPPQRLALLVKVRGFVYNMAYDNALCQVPLEPKHLEWEFRERPIFTRYAT